MTDGRSDRGPEAGSRIPRPALVMGFAGLLPPLAGLWWLVAMDFGWAAIGIFTAIFAYSALILSFLGGIWWGFAVAGGRRPDWSDLMLAVTPSLAAFLCLPVVGGWGPSGGLLLALLVLVSPLVDLRFVRSGLAPDWWMRLRMPLSIGLSSLLGGAVWLAT